MKQFFFSTLLTLFTLCGYSQAPLLPAVLPVSPEASSLTENAHGNVSLFSGKVSSSIPLNTFQIGSLSIPISLNYASGGFKIGQTSSKEGFGWSLGAIGVLNRVVRGKPDDDNGIIRKTEIPSSVNGAPPSLADEIAYYEDVTSNLRHYDSEADEFYISAPGLSTKFIFDENGDIIQFPFSKIKIEVIRDPSGSLPRRYDKFIVTNTDGVIYEFGGTGCKERITSSNLNLRGGIVLGNGTITSFYLKKITMPDGKYVTYTYNSFFEFGYSGVSESLTKGGDFPAQSITCEPVPSQNTPNVRTGIPFVADLSKLVKKVNYVRFNNLGVTKIETSEGQIADFIYDNTPDDAFGFSTSYLKKININSIDFHREFNLVYEFPAMLPTSNGITAAEDASVKRFFLKEVNYTMPGVSYPETVRYKLDYTQTEGLPSHLSFSQDFLGYYNGSVNTTLLAHRPNDTNWGIAASANRDFNGYYAQMGMLQKITYPTGGYEKYNYEPNTIAKWEPVQSIVTVSAGGQGFSDNGIPQRRVYESGIFHVYKNQIATLSMSGGHEGTPTNHSIGTFGTLIGLTPNAIEADGGALNSSNNIALTPGDYKLMISVKQGFAGEINLTYDRSETDDQAYDWVNREIGGVRLKSIEFYDPLSKQTNTKYYTYASKDLLNKSSGSSTFEVEYEEASYYRDELLCYNPATTTTYYATGDFNTLTLSTNTLVSSAIVNDPLCYEYVIESDDIGFKNGGVEHRFDITSPFERNVLLGFPVRDVPRHIADFTYGYELETTTFNKGLQNIIKVEHDYGVARNTQKYYTSKIVRRKFETSQLHWQNTTDPFDVTSYTFVSQWPILKHTKTTTFANGLAKVQVIDYEYTEQPGIAPLMTNIALTRTKDSKGAEIITRYKYPLDYTNPTILQTMAQRNMLGTVVSTTVTKNNQLVNTTTTQFRNWLSNGNLILPELIQVATLNNPVETRLHYYAYNIKGNPTIVSKENDVMHRYLWGYNHSFPVAEINTNSNVHYTSFEDYTDEAPWSGVINANIIEDPSQAITGKKIYEQQNFEFLGRTNGDVYVVTYWGNNSNGYTVSGTMPGWPKLIKTTKRGNEVWYLYEHRINGFIISVNGSGKIDELRAYPVTAQMKTITHFPFVGISSECDINNNIVYYEYDGFSRLYLVRDIDKNIIKKICYNYAGQPENCGVIRYFSAAASGVFTKNDCPSGTSSAPLTYAVPANTYSSTVSQSAADQLAIDDVNQHGQAYANNNGVCVPTVCSETNCSGQCINGVCEQGIIVLVSKMRHKELIDGQWVWVWECDWKRCFSDGTSVPYYAPGGTPEAECRQTAPPSPCP
ncbi:DUF5977 domain-containing protein [Ferruginibacter yonginensis]|uniref:DUF5977 domain-containing protein n=1 Tax=Ferruginibacter yonginensis TaxID=1310416 RepID=A0ABV8QSI5_9BACT